MGRLERKLDTDLIRRIKAGNLKHRAEGPTIKHQRKPRPAQSYRAARRNQRRIPNARP